MQSSPRPDVPVPPDAPTITDGAQAWSSLCERLTQRARLDAEIVRLTGVVVRSGTIEALEGVTLDTALNLVTRAPSSDRSMQITAAEVLSDMPATMRLFASGELSWGQVRAIVADIKRFPRDARRELDARIDASADLFAKMDSDDAIDAVRVAVEELRDPRTTERREDRNEAANFLWAQAGMFGPGKVYGQFDNVSLATLVTGTDAAAPPDDGRSLAQRRADGLIELAVHRCPADRAKQDDDAGGDEASPTQHRRLDRAVPACTVLLDYRDVSLNAAGIIEVNAPGCLPTITAAAVEALACDASVRVVLMDGARPLTVTSKVTAKALPEDVHRAVRARDRADRFPGSRRRIGHLHHTDKRGTGHHVDHVVGLAEASHRTVHRNSWKVTLDPATGEVTFTREGRSWTTVPRGTRLRRPRPRGSPDEDPSAQPR